QAHRERLATARARRGVGITDVAAATGVDLLLVRGGCFAALLVELFRAAETAIGFAFREEAIGVLAIDAEALGLTVGRVRAFDAGTFVPVNAEPQQVFHQLFFMANFAAVKVCIFNTQQERTAVMPREEPVVERGTRIAHVKETGGRRSKTNAE